MKKLIEVVETNKSGMESLLGETVFILCSGYYYRGQLIGVNDNSVCLKDAEIVYDANDFVKTGFSQKIPSAEWFVSIAAIESYGKVSK